MADEKTLSSNFIGQRTVSTSLLSSLGRIAGITKGTISGCTDVLGTTENIVGGGLIADAFLSNESSLTISSSSTDDTLAGSGARILSVALLDEGFFTVIKAIEMNGQTPVPITGTFARANLLRVITSGSSIIPNVGTIYLGTGTVTAGVPETVFIEIKPLMGKGLNSLLTVPKNRTAVTKELTLTASSDGNLDVTFFIKTRQNGGEGGEPFISEDDFTVFKATLPLQGDPIYIFQEKTDFFISAMASAGTANKASVKFDFELVTNSRLEP